MEYLEYIEKIKWLSIPGFMLGIYKLIKYIQERERNNPKNERLLKKCSRNFIDSVVTPVIEEAYFAKLTGIKTNHSEIDRFAKLKNKLGAQFTWDMISPAQSYIKLDLPDLYVSLTKAQKIKLQITFITTLICMFIGVILLCFTCLFLVGNWAATFMSVYLVGLFWGVGFFLYHLSSPLIYARFIERRLAKLENERLLELSGRIQELNNWSFQC